MKRAGVVIGVVIAALVLLLACAAYPLFTDLAPGRADSDTAVVILSGDMGFHIGMSPPLAKRIADRGLHVVGVNALGFAWRAQSPAGMGKLLQTAIVRALHDGHARKVVVIGQSYGADLVHVGAVHLPDAIRRRIAGIVLIVPTSDIYYQIGPREFLGWGTPDAQAMDSARQLDWTPVTCIYGREEPDSICPLMHAPGVRRVPLPGDHYLHHDSDLLFRTVWPAIRSAEARQ
jgi:type IV secretory pathway VirJ component